jgi:hypothetical protein
VQQRDHVAGELADVGLMGLVGDQQPQRPPGDLRLGRMQQQVVDGLIIAGGLAHVLGSPWSHPAVRGGGPVYSTGRSDRGWMGAAEG